MNLYLDLFLAFARVGAFTFGGGYAMLPILQRELVEKKGWVTDAELTDYFAIGQCTPGVIAVNTATFTGTKMAGTAGALVASAGILSPSVLIIAVIAATLQNFAHIPAVAHAFAGVRACVCALILLSVLRLKKSTLIDLPTVLLFCTVLLLSVFSGALSRLLPALSFLFSPVPFVILSGICGLLITYAGGRKA